MFGNFRRIALVLIAVLLASSDGLAGPIDPMAFTSLGPLALMNPGTYTITTTGGTPTLVVGGTTYTGVVSNGVAVFDFSSITTAQGTVLMASTGPGGLPVALLSQTSATIGGQVSVSASLDSPGSGVSNYGNGSDGTLPGIGAGGGGFGGQGGNGTGYGSGSGNSGMGGAVTANLALQLLGGSKGGAVNGLGSGGGGGGAIEIGAALALSISGGVSAFGGNGDGGGGGSGGGIFLFGSSVSISGTLDVHGGLGTIGNAGGPSPYPGSGSGGGGSILIESGSINNINISGTILDQGGLGEAGGGRNSGSVGQFAIEPLGFTPVPEPSSLVLLGTSALALLAGWLGRRSTGRSGKIGSTRLANPV